MSATTPVSVSNIKAFKSEVPSLLVQPYGSLRELEDVVVRAGSFTNAGAGWNTFTFPQAFDSPPSVSCQADGYTVEVKTITETGFLYRLAVDGSASLSKTTKTLYQSTSTSTSGYYPYIAKAKTSYQTSTFTVLTDVTLSGGSSSTTSDAIEIKYIAVEYGGE